MMTDKEKILRRYDKAVDRRLKWDEQLKDAYFYAIPNRKGSTNDARQHGDKVNVEVFDDTACLAVIERAAQLEGDIFPPFKEWLGLRHEKGEDAGGKFEDFSKVAQKRFKDAVDGGSNFHTEISLALADALISVGCLIISTGTDVSPLRFEAVPIDQIAPEEGIDGRLNTAFRTRDVALRDLQELWPNAKLDDDLIKNIEEKPQDMIKVIEAFIGDQQGGNGCDYYLFVESNKANGTEKGRACIFSYYYKVSPIVLFRYGKSSGEWMGRGPVINVLPTIKVLNRICELTLKNTAIAVTGMWQMDSDSDISVEAIRMAPGVIIPRAAGSRGLEPLQSPARFDISKMSVDEMRTNIRRAIMGPVLPPVDAGRRTATELELRAAEAQRVETPLTLRIMTELVEPLSRRILAILTSPEMANSNYYITPYDGEGSYEIDPTGPILVMERRADAARQVQSITALKQIAPESYLMVVNETKLISILVENLGIDKQFIRDDQEIEALQEQMAQAAAMAGQEQAQPAPSLANVR